MEPDYKLSQDAMYAKRINERLRQLRYYNGLNPMYSTRRRGKYKVNRSSHFKK